MADINIRISIVVPIYNVEKYLKTCIESIINQTYKNIEIILVDDGSTDCCLEICNYYSEIDSRIQVIHQKNGGVVSARKIGVATATGDYILTVDGDDWIEKDRVKVLVNEGIISTRPDMVYLSGYKRDYINNTILIDSDIPIKTFCDDEIRKQVFPLLMDINEVFCRRVNIYLWAWAIKRELLQAKMNLVDDKITMAEDVLCIWFCLLSAKKVTFTKQDSYHYVQRSSSIVYKAAVSPKNSYSHIKIWYHQLKKYLEASNISEEIRQIFNWVTICCIMMIDYDLLLKYHSKYLYPFTKVKRGHKIIVYGAGRMGHSLLRYLLNTKDYQVVLWVDTNEKENALLEYKISPIEDIEKVNYDYIVIAVMNSDMTKDIRQTLIMKGIPENKIATMDATAITEDAIPKEIIKN